MMTMKYSMCILVLVAGLSISISESISSGHNREGTESDLKRDGCHHKRDGCHQHAITKCQNNADCHHCGDHQKPYCSQGQCHCRECLDHLDCFHKDCTFGKTFQCSASGQCHCEDLRCSNHLDCDHHHCNTGQKHLCSGGICICRETTTTSTTTTAATPPPSTTTTPPPPPTTTATTTETPTTTPEPTTVDPQLLTKCTTHTECSGHVCQAGQHSYCSFGQHSSDCQCTVCTDDSHCFCPAGLVGTCHFNLFDHSYSCVCGFAPDTTTQPKLTTTVKSITHLLTTHIIRNDPTKTQETVQPSPAEPSTTPVPTTTTQHGTNTTQQTTLALGVRCHVCGDNDNGIPCDTRSIYTGNLQQCGPGEDFCMTDLIHNGQPFPTIFKRCVTEEECRNKWLHQTSDLEHCTNYGNVLVEGHYSCHFCCTSDGCNSNQIPEKSTLYIKA